METDLERGRRLGRKYVFGTFVAAAAAFVVATTLQIVFGVFGTGEGGGAAALEEGKCAVGLRGLNAAVERAVAASGRLPEGAGPAPYRDALLPEWEGEGAIARECASEPRGRDAFAAVLKLKVAGEELALRQEGELGPLRKTLATYLSH